MYQFQCHQKPKAGIYALVALWWLVWLWQAAALEATRGGCGRVPAQGVASAPRDAAWSMASPPERPSVGTRSPTGQPVEKHTGKMSFCKINEQPVLGARCVWAGQPCTWDSAVHCLQRGWAQRGLPEEGESRWSLVSWLAVPVPCWHRAPALISPPRQSQAR